MEFSSTNVENLISDAEKNGADLSAVFYENNAFFAKKDIEIGEIAIKIPAEMAIGWKICPKCAEIDEKSAKNAENGPKNAENDEKMLKNGENLSENGDFGPENPEIGTPEWKMWLHLWRMRNGICTHAPKTHISYAKSLPKSSPAACDWPFFLVKMLENTNLGGEISEIQARWKALGNEFPVSDLSKKRFRADFDEISPEKVGKSQKLTENGPKITENGPKITENGSKITENGSKITENGSEITENVSNSSKMPQNGSKMAENASKSPQNYEKSAEIAGIRWARGMYTSRRFKGHLYSENGPKTDKNGSKMTENGSKMAENASIIDKNAGIPSLGGEIGCFLPIIDLLDHRSDAESNVSNAQNFVILTYIKRISKGEKLYLNYGEFSSEQFLLAFGFAENFSNFDEFALKLRAENGISRVFGVKSAENDEKIAEIGWKITGNGPKIDENGSKIDENGSKMTENGSKMTENGSKLTENGPKSIENGSKLTVNEQNVSKTPKNGSKTPENASKPPENAYLYPKIQIPGGLLEIMGLKGVFLARKRAKNAVLALKDVLEGGRKRMAETEISEITRPDPRLFYILRYRQWQWRLATSAVRGLGGAAGSIAGFDGLCDSVSAEIRKFWAQGRENTAKTGAKTEKTPENTEKSRENAEKTPENAEKTPENGGFGDPGAIFSRHVHQDPSEFDPMSDSSSDENSENSENSAESGEWIEYYEEESEEGSQK